jgi:tetratricopeptide (TPR) repeat protein
VALLLAPALLASVALPAHARADEPAADAGATADPRQQSREQFELGVRALEDGRPGEALASFESAYALYPHWSTWYNIALCQRALGRPREMLLALERFLEGGADAIDQEQRATVATLLREGEQKVARVHLSVHPAGGEVTLDGERVATGRALRVNPGDHVLQVRAAGHETATRAFRAPSGEQVRLTLSLAPIAVRSAPPARPPAPRDEPPPAPQQSALDATFWAVAAISLGALAAGGVMGAIALGDSRAYSDPSVPDDEAERRRNRGEVLRVAADVAFGAALVGGVGALFLANREPGASGGRLVVVGGRFR